MRILVADDQPLDRSILHLTLEKWRYEVIECCDGNEALAALLKEDSPQLAILDWMMPGVSGPEICKIIRQQELHYHYIYILLLTAKDQKDDIIEGMRSGADDYIIKPVDMHELQVRLRAGRRIIDLQNQLVSAQETLKIKATHDFLTGLWNRAAIIDILNREHNRSLREHHSMGVIMLDLDRFKDVNDSRGHGVGDAVLCEVAQRMLAGARTYDSVGRYGGEEFMIIVPGGTAEETVKVAERIREGIAESPVLVPGESISMTASFGAAAADITRSIAPLDLVNWADKALYSAKSEGRNRVNIWVD